MDSLLYIYLNFISLILIILMVLVGVGFLILLERKILSYVQIRKGPNKVSILGILQPFSDAFKLLSKELFIIIKSNYYIYYLSPMMMFFFMLSMWFVEYIYTNIYFMNYSLLIVVIILTLMSYSMLMTSWVSNSMYSLLGMVRGMVQILSYEVSFILIIMSLMALSESYSYVDFIKWQMYLCYLFILLPLFIMFFISVLAEMSRTPMDFVEGESELVSGFNVEYFSSGFTLMFLAEYGMIIFFSYLLMIMFITMISYWLICFSLIFIIMIILIIRSIMPRMRYDEMMFLCWKIILPMILSYFIFILSYKFLFSCLL